MPVEAARVIQLVRTQLGIASVQETDRIVEDLGAESMDIVNIVVLVEEEYGICIDDMELPGISTVADLIALAQRISR